MDQFTLDINPACDLELRIGYSNAPSLHQQTVAFDALNPATGNIDTTVITPVGAVYTVRAVDLALKFASLTIGIIYNSPTAGDQVSLDFDQGAPCGRPPFVAKTPPPTANPLVRPISNGLFAIQVNLR